MSRVLITGASGFIGSRLIRLLKEQGQDVVCTVRRTSRTDHLESLGAQLVQADITQPESLPAAVEGVDVVYHLAGLVKTFRRQAFFEVNEQGSANLAEVCARQPQPPVLVVVSTLAAGGPSRRDRLREETDPEQPVSNYGKSKLAGELAAARFAGQVPISIVRPPIVFGPGDAEMLEMIRPIKLSNVHLVPGFRANRFSIIHADDLSNLILLAAERGKRLGSVPDDQRRGIYFAGCGESPTYAELGHHLARAMGRKRAWILHVPKRLTWGVATYHEIVSRLLRKPSIMGFDKAREATAGSWSCSNQRAIDELGYQPASDLATRLAETMEWYRSEGWL